VLALDFALLVEVVYTQRRDYRVSIHAILMGGRCLVVGERT
jgi:hypothetical protein